MQTSPDTQPTHRCCLTCKAVYRSGFACCPSDGTALTPFETDPMIGTTLVGQYVIEECVGEGAMGRVYRAHHSRLSRRQFAVKILIGDLAAEPEMRLRFAREAEAASRLEHPNVVTVTDFGESPERLLYIVMELIRGRTLTKLIADESRLSEKQTINLTRQLCLGLAHAHEQGLIHRDFKPENVALIEDESGFVPRILDFGLAIIADPNEAATRLTSAGLVLGTPAYTAPEQARGEELDERADLFALGISVYEMLAGDIPFRGSVMEVLAANAMDQPPPIAERSPGAVVTPALEQIVLKLMAKKREDRFSTAREVIRALDSLDADGRAATMLSAPILSTPIPPVGAPAAAATGPATAATTAVVEQGTARKSKAPWILAFVAVCAAAGGAVALTRGGGDSGPQVTQTAPAPAAAPSDVTATPATDPAPATDQDGTTAPVPAMAPDAATGPAAPPARTTDPAEAGTQTPDKPDRARRSRRSKRKPRPAATVEPVVNPDPPAPIPDPAPPITKPTPAPTPVPVQPKRDPPPKKPIPAKPRGPLDARASLKQFSASGSLSTRVVRRAVDRVSPKFRSCYKTAARKARKNASGSVSVKFVIDETSRARRVSVGKAPLRGLSSCIKSAVSGVRTRVAPDVGSVRVKFSVTFSPVKP